MDLTEHTPLTQVLEVREPTQVGEARRQAAALAARVGLPAEAAARAALVATELAQNLVKHARGGGELLLRCLAEAEGPAGVELLAVDAGPGIADVGCALQDGFSTAGTQGSGLGAVRRQSDAFDVHSSAGGTAVLARVQARGARGAAPAAAPGVTFGVVCRPIPGGQQSGDAWALLAARAGAPLQLLVVDGLGHGPSAQDAARVVVDTVRAAHGLPAADVLARVHLAARGTRGAAASLLTLAPDGRGLDFAGVGNVAGWLVHGGQRQRGLVSQPGTLGASLGRVGGVQAELPPDGLVVLHTDGLLSGWSLEGEPGLTRRHPALVAAVLARAFTRGRDDLTVAVLAPLPPTAWATATATATAEGAA